MRRYTRFANCESAPHANAFDDPLEVAERVFRRKAPERMSPYNRTAQAAKQIVQDEATRRQSLTEALRAARLERANRFGKLAARQRRSLPD
jgi:hypothetical protein